MSSIEIVPYDPLWPKLFEDEHRRILGLLGAVSIKIEHHGSTAVLNMPAKPVIDIQISVECLQPMDTYRMPLGLLGYVHVPHADDSFCPYFHRPLNWPHTYHVHVVGLGSEQETRTLAFRDYLRDHAIAAEAYAKLKRTLACRFFAGDALSRQAYAEAKGTFIEEIVTIARAQGYPRQPK